MPSRHLFQPLQGRYGDDLVAALNQLAGAGSSCRIISAWARTSGVDPLTSALVGFRDRGGTVEALIGIDQRGTTIEALQALLEVTDSTYVLHDTANTRRSFHAKLYAVRNAEQAHAAIGSGNLTRGGLFANYEVFSVSSFDLAAPHEADEFATIWQGIDDLLADDATVKRLDVDLLDELARRRLIVPEGSAPRNDESRPGSEAALFGRREGLPPVPGRSRERSRSRREAERAASSGLRRAIVETSRGRPGQVQLRRDVLNWIAGDATAVRLRDAEGATRVGRVVATHARGGGVNTRRIELPGVDQNSGDAFLLLEQLADGALSYRILDRTDPLVRLLTLGRSRLKAYCLQEMRDGDWVTTQSSP